jgi:hypothetical protein
VKLRVFLNQQMKEEREEQLMLGFEYGSDHVTTLTAETITDVCDVYLTSGREGVEALDLRARRLILTYLADSEKTSESPQMPPMGLPSMERADSPVILGRRRGRGRKLRRLSPTQSDPSRAQPSGRSLSVDALVQPVAPVTLRRSRSLGDVTMQSTLSRSFSEVFADTV